MRWLRVRIQLVRLRRGDENDVLGARDLRVQIVVIVVVQRRVCVRAAEPRERRAQLHRVVHKHGRDIEVVCQCRTSRHQVCLCQVQLLSATVRELRGSGERGRVLWRRRHRRTELAAHKLAKRQFNPRKLRREEVPPSRRGERALRRASGEGTLLNRDVCVAERGLEIGNIAPALQCGPTSR